MLTTFEKTKKKILEEIESSRNELGTTFDNAPRDVLAPSEVRAVLEEILLNINYILAIYSHYLKSEQKDGVSEFNETLMKSLEELHNLLSGIKDLAIAKDDHALIKKSDEYKKARDSLHRSLFVDTSNQPTGNNINIKAIITTMMELDSSLDNIFDETEELKKTNQEAYRLQLNNLIRYLNQRIVNEYQEFYSDSEVENAIKEGRNFLTNVKENGNELENGSDADESDSSDDEERDKSHLNSFYQTEENESDGNSLNRIDIASMDKDDLRKFLDKRFKDGVIVLDEILALVEINPGFSELLNVFKIYIKNNQNYQYEYFKHQLALHIIFNKIRIATEIVKNLNKEDEENYRKQLFDLYDCINNNIPPSFQKLHDSDPVFWESYEHTIKEHIEDAQRELIKAAYNAKQNINELIKAAFSEGRDIIAHKIINTIVNLKLTSDVEVDIYCESKIEPINALLKVTSSLPNNEQKAIYERKEVTSSLPNNVQKVIYERNAKIEFKKFLDQLPKHYSAITRPCLDLCIDKFKAVFIENGSINLIKEIEEELDNHRNKPSDLKIQYKPSDLMTIMNSRVNTLHSICESNGSAHLTEINTLKSDLDKIYKQQKIRELKSSLDNLASETDESKNKKTIAELKSKLLKLGETGTDQNQQAQIQYAQIIQLTYILDSLGKAEGNKQEKINDLKSKFDKLIETYESNEIKTLKVLLNTRSDLSHLSENEKLEQMLLEQMLKNLTNTHNKIKDKAFIGKTRFGFGSQSAVYLESLVTFITDRIPQRNVTQKTHFIKDEKSQKLEQALDLEPALDYIKNQINLIFKGSIYQQDLLQLLDKKCDTTLSEKYKSILIKLTSIHDEIPSKARDCGFLNFFISENPMKKDVAKLIEKLKANAPKDISNSMAPNAATTANPNARTVQI